MLVSLLNSHKRNPEMLPINAQKRMLKIIKAQGYRYGTYTGCLRIKRLSKTVTKRPVTIPKRHPFTVLSLNIFPVLLLVGCYESARLLLHP
jgi:hypothetical protein